MSSNPQSFFAPYIAAAEALRAHLQLIDAELSKDESIDSFEHTTTRDLAWAEQHLTPLAAAIIASRMTLHATWTLYDLEVTFTCTLKDGEIVLEREESRTLPDNTGKLSADLLDEYHALRDAWPQTMSSPILPPLSSQHKDVSVSRSARPYPRDHLPRRA